MPASPATSGFPNLRLRVYLATPHAVSHKVTCIWITAYNLYIDPPLGRVGMTETEVRASGRPALIAKMSMEKVGRAFEKGETEGFMKILVDSETKLIVGASLLGAGGDEVIHTILDLMYAKTPFTVLQRAMHIHPTVSELLPTMMNDLKPLQ